MTSLHHDSQGSGEQGTRVILEHTIKVILEHTGKCPLRVILEHRGNPIRINLEHTLICGTHVAWEGLGGGWDDTVHLP